MANQPEKLIRILLDEDADPVIRDDAATDLGNYEDPEAEKALLEIACNPEEDDELSDCCGESLAEIWSRKEELDLEKFARLNNVARKIAASTLITLRKDWCQLLPPDDLE